MWGLGIALGVEGGEGWMGVEREKEREWEGNGKGMGREWEGWGWKGVGMVGMVRRGCLNSGKGMGTEGWVLRYLERTVCVMERGYVGSWVEGCRVRRGL